MSDDEVVASFVPRGTCWTRRCGRLSSLKRTLAWPTRCNEENLVTYLSFKHDPFRANFQSELNMGRRRTRLPKRQPLEEAENRFFLDSSYLPTTVQNSLILRHPHFIIRSLMSLGVSELMNERSRAAEQADVQANEQTDERVAQYLCLNFWLFWTTARPHNESFCVENLEGALLILR